LGTIVLDERPGPGAVAGMVLILAGSRLATQKRPGSPLGPFVEEPAGG
jgi:hypothetical protein